MVFPQAAHAGTMHHFAPRLVAFEHTTNPSIPSPNILIWVGGLGDGLLTVPYTSSLAKALPKDWTLAEVLLSSSYTGWGTSSLSSDAKELSKCITYFRRLKTHIVLMGHSTGCQDVMEYLVGPNSAQNAAIDGAILQAPISDREAMSFLMAPGLYERSVAAAQAMVAAGQGDEILSSTDTGGFFGGSASARRWLSLASPDHDGEDDYFSSDLPETRLKGTFGSLPSRTPLCILYSGNDEYVPKEIDKKALVERWMEIARQGSGAVNERYSGLIEDATHNFRGDPESVLRDVVARVSGFLATLSSARSAL